MERRIGIGALGVLLALGSSAAFAQTAPANQSTQSNQSNQSQPAQQQGSKNQPGTAISNTTGLTLDAAPPPVSAEEEAAYKAFDALPNSDVAKKISAGEEFLQKYPESRYRPPIYSILTVAYVQTGQSAKAFDIGDKEIQLKPDDVQTLAILAQTIPRAMNGSTPNPEQQLEKAETYGKRALDIVPTLPKPAALTDEKFAAAKSQTLSMAHSGLGLVDIRRGKYAEAIPELEQSVKLVPDPDPVNLYLLGLADVKTSHFEEAQAAYDKCAAIPSSLQQACKSGSEEAKKQGSTQLSAPH
ncbi:MAG TPA: tetratricopeptide repeat protein [Candidatus Acidoferrum sp.]|nr:tetratricopeptide repeat protein [Candidatus Acidoferrum sp.]